MYGRIINLKFFIFFFIFSGRLFTCRYCLTNFISEVFLQKHIIKCLKTPIDLLPKCILKIQGNVFNTYK